MGQVGPCFGREARGDLTFFTVVLVVLAVLALAAGGVFLLLRRDGGSPLGGRSGAHITVGLRDERTAVGECGAFAQVERVAQAVGRLAPARRYVRADRALAVHGEERLVHVVDERLLHCALAVRAARRRFRAHVVWLGPIHRQLVHR